MKSVCENVVYYTKNLPNAYEMRNRCKKDNIEVEYLKGIGNLLSFLITKEKGIVILDLKYFKSFKILSEFCIFRNNGEYKFVCLTDDKSKVKFVDKNVSVYSYEEVSKLQENLPKIIVETNTVCEYNRKALLTNIVTQILENYKISPKHVGFNYLKDCIDIAIRHKRDVLFLNKDIYPVVAQMYRTTIDNVEKNIRLAIKSASTNHPELYSKDTFCDGKVTNRTFVSHIVEEVDLHRINKLQQINNI